MNPDAILAAALVGTERQALSLPHDDSALGSLFGELDPAAREATLLHAAGTLALWRVAGYALESDPHPLLEPAAVEERPTCPPAVARYLERLLSGEYKEVLPEFLEALAETEKRVPSVALPALFTLAQKDASLRPLLEPVMGVRGRWLARQNPQWADFRQDNDDDTWAYGTLAARKAYLERLRAHDPAGARAKLEAVWKQEGARERVGLLEALRMKLSMADEGWLELLLDDRSKEVRRVAAKLLAALPESRFAARMRERLPKVVTLEGEQLVLLDYGEPDQAALRDGLEKEAPKGLATQEERRWRMMQVLPSLSPQALCEQLKLTPEGLLEVLEKMHGSRDFLTALTTATSRLRDPQWAERLLSLPTGGTEALLDLVPPDVGEAYVERLLEQPTAPGMLVSLLEGLTHTWSPGFTAAFIAYLDRNVKTTQIGMDWALQYRLHVLAARMSPDYKGAWPNEGINFNHWQTALDKAQSLLEFRKAMLETLQGAA